MYNTVGETAGVTQDVGSDPTVGDPDPDPDPDPDVYHCCTLCGMQLEEEETVKGMEQHEGEEEGVDMTVFDWSEMEGMEDEDEEMDGEPDTTGDDEDRTSHFGGRKGDAKEGCGERISHLTHPERKTS